ncbi:hypothetical protein X943_002559 [Babesia divergens]|uniref:SAP domain-containing protein n=1 Tax=Babesia divergens TaxID=32595 RepID=A0AAD9GKZ2_BABDI|nr:hypothetical protein X943_002559 [Babesia divergens]
MEEEELRKKTISELKVMLQEKGLKTTGKKEDLLNRLLGRETSQPNEDSESNAHKSGGSVGNSKQIDKDKTTNTNNSNPSLDENDSTNMRKDKVIDYENADDVSVSMSPKDTPNPSEQAPKSTQIFKMTDEERMAWRAKRFNVPVKKDKQRKTGGNATHDGNKVGRYNGSGHQFTPEERAKRRLERLMKRKGVEPGVKLDDEELEKRRKRLERFGKK